jgi:hypothetical protein
MRRNHYLYPQHRATSRNTSTTRRATRTPNRIRAKPSCKMTTKMKTVKSKTTRKCTAKSRINLTITELPIKAFRNPNRRTARRPIMECSSEAQPHTRRQSVKNKLKRGMMKVLQECPPRHYPKDIQGIIRECPTHSSASQSPQQNPIKTSDSSVNSIRQKR